MLAEALSGSPQTNTQMHSPNFSFCVDEERQLFLLRYDTVSSFSAPQQRDVHQEDAASMNSCHNTKQKTKWTLI